MSSRGEVRRLLAGVGSGEIALNVLAVEGSSPTGPKGPRRFQILSGTGRPMLDWVTSLAGHARHLMAVRNLTGEPRVIGNQEARYKLGDLVDGRLMHDCGITHRRDESVEQMTAHAHALWGPVPCLYAGGRAAAMHMLVA